MHGLLRLSICRLYGLLRKIDGHAIGGNPNAVDVDKLNPVDKIILRESLSEARNLQQRLELDYVR